jgi:hypothetical protein
LGTILRGYLYYNYGITGYFWAVFGLFLIFLGTKALKALVSKAVIFGIISLGLFLVVYKGTIEIRGLRPLIGLVSPGTEYYRAIY